MQVTHFFQLFYMIKGDMVLKVIERGEHRDIPINEGEVSNTHIPIDEGEVSITYIPINEGEVSILKLGMNKLFFENLISRNLVKACY